LFEGEQEAEDGTAGGVGGEVIEVAAEGAMEGLDAGGVPVGEIGEGAFLDLAVLTKRLAEEDGGRGVTVGDGLDVHGYIISHIKLVSSTYIYIYMGTIKHRRRVPSITVREMSF
jgi:hypothetical protein